MDCIFCRIINREMPADIVYEDDKTIAFKDIHPKAPIHILIVPKKHIETVNHLAEEDKELIGELFLAAQKVADKAGIKDKGYKLSFNVGRGAGQLVDHIHLHMLGGWQDEAKMSHQETP